MHRKGLIVIDFLIMVLILSACREYANLFNQNKTAYQNDIQQNPEREQLCGKEEDSSIEEIEQEILDIFDDKMNLVFDEWQNEDNLYPEKINPIESKEILNIYESFDYGEYSITIFDTNSGHLYVGYSHEEQYFSICERKEYLEIEKEWLKDSNPILFETYENVLGSSGVIVKLSMAAASLEVFYIEIDTNQSPHLLFSARIGSDLEEVDFDQDGQKELVTNFDAVIFKLKNGVLHSTKEAVLIFNGRIFYNPDTNIFERFYYLDEGYISQCYYYDAKTESLITTIP